MKVKLKQYPWSSYPDYIGIRKAPAWLNREAILKNIHEKPDKARIVYMGFVEEGIRKGVERPWENLMGQVVLGGEAFVRSIQARLKGKKNREVPSLRQLAVRPNWKAIVRVVEEVDGKWEALRSGRRSDPKRAMMIYLGREQGGMSLKELGKLVGLKESSVSQTAGRVSKLRRENAAWNKVVTKIEEYLVHNS